MTKSPQSRDQLSAQSPCCAQPRQPPVLALGRSGRKVFTILKFSIGISSQPIVIPAAEVQTQTALPKQSEWLENIIQPPVIVTAVVFILCSSPLHCTYTDICLEPIGGSAPKFSAESSISNLVRSQASSLAMSCPAQASPVPSFRSVSGWQL